MEGRTYRCRFEEAEGSVRMWVVRRPALGSEGRTWDEAIEGLTSEICRVDGDGDPKLEFAGIRRPVLADEPWIIPAWAVLWNTRSFALANPPAECFAGGLCNGCDRGLGDRSQARLRALRGGGGDWCSSMFPGAMSALGEGLVFLGFAPPIASERLIDALTEEERAPFEWRRLDTPARSTRAFFECIPRSFVPPVVVRGFSVNGWRCGECSGVHASCSSNQRLVDHGDGSVTEFACTSEVAKVTAPVFAFGDANGFQLVFRRHRAIQLAASSLKGLYASNFAAVAPEMVGGEELLPQK